MSGTYCAPGLHGEVIGISFQPGGIHTPALPNNLQEYAGVRCMYAQWASHNHLLFCHHYKGGHSISHTQQDRIDW